jgi:mRNA-degrading endonuclease RelE of RelBE toxin-antitoxin system
MTWGVNVQRDAAKQLESIPPDRRELTEDPFRGLIKPLKGKKFKALYRKVSGRYRIIFEPIFATHTINVLAVLLRNEATYR